MTESVLDEVDEAILYALQENARETTTREIGDGAGVTPTTVSNRIAELEADGIVTNYLATLNYNRAGFPLHVLITATASIVEREDLAGRALEIPGVVNVRELMVGQDNVHLETVGRHNDDITRIVTELSEMGLAINNEVLIRDQSYCPLSYLDPELTI